MLLNSVIHFTFTLLIYFFAEKCFVFQKAHGCFEKQPQKISLMSIRVILFKCLKKLKESIDSIDVEQWHGAIMFLIEAVELSCL